MKRLKESRQMRLIVMEAQLSGLGVICQSAERFPSLSNETSENKPASTQHRSTEENGVLKVQESKVPLLLSPCFLFNPHC